MSLPFSAAVRTDNLLFLSGSIGIDPATGQLAPGGIQAETRQTLENIKAASNATAARWSGSSSAPCFSPTWPSGAR